MPACSGIGRFQGVMLRTQHLSVAWVEECAAIRSLLDVVGRQRDAASSAPSLTSGPLAAPVGGPESGEAPGTVLGGQQLRIGALRGRSHSPMVGDLYERLGEADLRGFAHHRALEVTGTGCS